ncbi:DDE-type integrase/transposase/recombinase [Pseudomonas fluorescens]|uniref:DDE-type integrase/transposase/recombinase n=1 Tax=Pseudomonas fluorescens TaxID=294 RepID=UPI001CD517FC|nr:DDE-type integrase/transposase/recombinase [Pseudomonas fluorescens]
MEVLAAPDVLKREFDVKAINQVRCVEVTGIKVGKRWLYLAAVLDLFARRIVGWSFSMISDATPTCAALRMAVELRGRPKRCCFIRIKAANTPATNLGMGCASMVLCKA